MKKILDLHIHSRFSRACSKNLTFSSIAKAAEKKGLDIVGTGDFTHPTWFKEAGEFLTEKYPGLYALKDGSSPTLFLFSTELSCIYKKGERARRLHLLVLAPNLKAVETINKTLLARGANLSSDGRPILGLDAKELLKIMLEIDDRILFVPAHAWTPWFSVFGSQSGFDSLEECFDELASHIYAIETGLSSDPEMNWRLSALDGFLLISNSDAHSAENLGREANVMDLGEAPSYEEFSRIIKEKDRSKFLYTIEFFPEEGKYHFDGHRACGVALHPKETKKLRGLCPNCKRPLTIGVLSRVEELADRKEGARPANAIPFKRVVPLDEIVGDVLGVGRASKKVAVIVSDMLSRGIGELRLITEIPLDELQKMAAPEIVEAIRRVRAGELTVSPGYDGVYGKIKIFRDEERNGKKQTVLF